MTFGELKKKYSRGVKLLQDEGYYTRVVDEIALLVKYFDSNYFYHLLTENIFDDIKGTFRSFIIKELPDVYRKLQQDPTRPLDEFFKREYNSLVILKSCTLNIRYQVSGLMRFEQTRNLPFKSTYLQGVHRKLNGKIQEYYRELSENYKQYFREQFVHTPITHSRISIHCMEQLMHDIDEHFIQHLSRFQALHEAIAFVHDYMILQLRGLIHQRITAIFHNNGNRIERLVNYFIEDLKRDFIRMLDRQLRKGKEFEWIRRGLLLFLDSNRFEDLLRKVIFQSLVIHQTSPRRLNRTAG